MKLRNVLFWDTTLSNIDFETHSAYIIERIVTYGNFTEWKELLSFYGKEKVIMTVKNLRSMDDKTFHFLGTYFNIPKEEFRCFAEKQSTPKHFPF